MKYIVYQTINIVNGKIYIGVHGTETPYKFDGYIGCGAYRNSPKSYNKGKTYLHKAILKYGIKSFKRITLKVFDTREEALDFERLIVTEEFISRTDTYNITIEGGYPPNLSKKVFQFDHEGNLLKIWNSRIELEEFYECSDWKILDCITKKREFYKTYLSDSDTINIEDYRETVRDKKIYQYNKDGIHLATFESVSDAALKLDVDPKSISNAIHQLSLCIDCYFLYSEDSIEDLLYNKKTKLCLNKRPIYQYSLDGEYIRSFSSLAEAAKEVKVNHSNIIRAAKNNRTCGGYKWSYHKSEKYESSNEKHLKPVKVAQYDKEGNLIKIWDSVAKCKKEFPGCQRVCKMQARSYKGFVFKYVK